jgi:hypothetical protein
MVIEDKREKEREYLQRTIIQMELKQFAESIQMIAFRKRSDPKLQSVTIRNRPFLWAERLEFKNQPSKKF